MKLQEWLGIWLNKYTKHTVKLRTYDRYKYIIEKHINPKLGDYELDDLNGEVLQDFVLSELESGNLNTKGKLANNSVIGIVNVLKGAMSTALSLNKINKNEMSKIKLPSPTEKPVNAFERHEQEKIVRYCLESKKNNHIGIVICLYTGIRLGELLALTWNCVDFENKKLKVLRAITQVPKFDAEGNVLSRKTVLSDTKTACSVRTIPITDIVVKTLKEWKEKQTIREQTNPNVTKSLTLSGSYVFANDDGTLRTYSGCRHIFDRFKKRNGLKNSGIHFHSLRHTFSNMLFELNENPKVIQQLLGHKDVKTTITVYNSVNSDYVKEATDKLNEKIIEDEMKREQEEKEKKEKGEQEKQRELSDEEFDRKVAEMLREQEERKRRRRERDFEM